MEKYNLIGDTSWRDQIPHDLAYDYTNNTEYVVLRPILFFYREQIIKHTQLMRFFTDEAITLFIHDKFIEKHG